MNSTTTAIYPVSYDLILSSNLGLQRLTRINLDSLLLNLLYSF